MPFDFKKLELEGAVLIEPKVFRDDRGFFMESYQKDQFKENGIDCEFIQDNHSKSTKGVLRGLHFQKPPFTQAKLVRCTNGKVIVAIVDLRENSPTFGKYLTEELSEENAKMLFVPRGFAHGFCVLSDEAEFLYKVDNEYSPENESGLLWNDSAVGIEWPIKNPILSDKDKELPGIDNCYKF